MSNEDTKASAAVLMVCHIAGMADMVAMPLWIGALMQRYGLDAQVAGLAVTVFLLTVAAASSLLSARFDRLPRKAIATLGFAVAACAFMGVSNAAAGAGSIELLGLHSLAGLGVGMGLSMTHGAMGRTANPHRLFALASGLLGVFAIAFLGVMFKVLSVADNSVLFVALAGVMSLAAIVSLLGYPRLASSRSGIATGQPIPRAAWMAIGVVILLNLNYAMIFAFIERVGVHRGFASSLIANVLLATAAVNLLPGPIAAVLQRRLSPIAVAAAMPVLQAIVALTAFNTSQFMPYAAAAAICVVPVIFGQIFLFGLISQLDPSGRAPASTPAMIMLGSSMGPLLGGALVQHWGYSAIGAVAVVVGLAAVVATVVVGRELRFKPKASAIPEGSV